MGLNPIAAGDAIRYDKLGNLIADTSRDIYSQEYDYRNLLMKSYVKPTPSGGAQDQLTFEYDQSHRRIKKRHWYQYWTTCGGPPPPPPIGLNETEPEEHIPDVEQDATVTWAVVTDNDPASMLTLTGGGGGGGDPCLQDAWTERYYLYDNGVLLAVFDKDDVVDQVFVNGSAGVIASYDAADELHYTISDHLGSARVTMDQMKTSTETSSVVRWQNYYAFGQTLDMWAGPSNPFEFTGKEHDQHSTFDFHYFGERYYDARIGQFASFDKASQFPGGYRYGNNPILGTDPDGNLFGIDDLIISSVAFVTSYVTTGLTTNDWGLENLKNAGVSAFSAWVGYNTGGAAAGSLFKAGSAGFAITSATVGGAVGGFTNSVGGQLANDVSFNRLDWDLVGQSALSGGAGGLAGGAFGRYVATDPFTPGYVGGFVGGGVAGAFNGDWTLGASMGLFSAQISGPLTEFAYRKYGEYLTKKALGENAFGNDIARAAPDPLIKDHQPLDMYNCKDCTVELRNSGLPSSVREVRFGSPDWGLANHIGHDIGGNLFGQRFILSKQGAAFPITVNTARQLSTGAWLPRGGFTYKGHHFPRSAGAYGPSYYEF